MKKETDRKGDGAEKDIDLKSDIKSEKGREREREREYIKVTQIQ